MEYHDPYQAIKTIFARIGAVDIEYIKVLRLAHYHMYAVKYKDQQEQSQLAFCSLYEEEAGSWYCNRFTFAPSYQQVIHDEKTLRFFPVAIAIKPVYGLGGYISDLSGEVSKVRLIDREGQIIEDGVENGLVLFVSELSLVRMVTVELYSSEGTLLASQRFSLADIFSKSTSFAPFGDPWPTALEAVLHYLSDPVSMNRRPENRAEAESIQVIKEQILPQRHLYALRYKNVKGESCTSFYGTTRYDSGFWQITTLFWRSSLTDKVGELKEEQQQPWLILTRRFDKKVPVSLHHRCLYEPFLAIGLVVDHGFGVEHVRLVDYDGRVLEDTVKDGLVLFLSERPLHQPVEARLYNHEGVLVGKHNAFKTIPGQLERLSYAGPDNPEQAASEFICWIGATDIQLDKTADAQDKQSYAVAYKDLQGEQRHCICHLYKQESGSWYVDSVRFEIQDDNSQTFMPYGPARSDPQQAIAEALYAPPYSFEASWLKPVPFLNNDHIAEMGSIQLIKRRSIPGRQFQAVRYKDVLHGRSKLCFCLVSQCSSGLWLVSNMVWEKDMADNIKWHERHTARPYLGSFRWFNNMPEPPSHFRFLHVSFLMVGLIVGDGFEVTRVRLLDRHGLVLEDTVEDNLVLFMSEQPVYQPLRAELYDSAGTLVRQHHAY